MYSSHFKRIHAKLGSRIPIAKFADLVDPKAIGLNSTADFFDPIQFDIRFAEDQVLKFVVPVVGNDHWKKELQTAVASLISSPTVELRTINDIPLDDVHNEKTLSRLGALNIYANSSAEKPIRTTEEINVPAEYSIRKSHELQAWIAVMMTNEGLSDAIASHLQNKDVHEIEHAIGEGASISEMIKKHVQSSAEGWSEFSQKHHINANQGVDSSAVLSDVSDTILNGLRSSVAAHSQEINQHVALKRAKESAKASGRTFKPVLLSAAAGSSSFDLFRNMTNHALSSPLLHKTIFNNIYRSPRRLLSAIKQSKNSGIGDDLNHHPRNAQIQHSLLTLNGTYPADYLVHHTQTDMTPTAEYKGNARQTYKAYHTFLGVHQVPPARVVKNNVPLECPHGNKMTHKHIPTQKKKSDEEDDDAIVEANLVPISSMFANSKIGMNNNNNKVGANNKIADMMNSRLIASSALGMPLQAPKTIPLQAPNTVPLYPLVGNDAFDDDMRHLFPDLWKQ